MKRARRDLGLIALIIGFLILAAAVVATLLLFRAQQETQDRVVHALRVEEKLGTVLSDLQDIETGQRGFMITRDAGFLQPYLDGRSRLEIHLGELRELVRDNPVQSNAVDTLSNLSRRRVERLQIGVDRVRANPAYQPGPDMLRGTGKKLMDALRAQVAMMKATEARLLDKRITRVREQSQLLSFWLLFSVALTALLAWFATRDARARARRAVEVGNALERTNQRLIEEAASREAAEAQIRQMHKMESIGQLTGGIAHDFNNMLAIVIGSLDIARRRIRTQPERAEESISNAMQGAERAAQLTSRLLAFARRQPLAPAALDANRLVAEMSELLRRTIGETIRLETVLAGGLWPAFIDAGQLENALVNLCVNARDAMPSGGRLTIETANAHLDDGYAGHHSDVSPGQYVMVSVTDTGMGMTADVIEKAFDPFFSTKEVGKGTGLGLSQVYGFVKQSGGHVKIYSELGVGTTVKLYLPRHFGEADRRGTPDLPIELPRGRGDEVILVVEDEPQVRAMSVDALRELGYGVLQAAGPIEALTMIDAQPHLSLLFTDIVMPDMTGRELAQAARAKRPELRVLYTTGYTRNAIVHNGMLDQDVDFLAKPFTFAQLAVKIRQVLDA